MSTNSRHLNLALPDGHLMNHMLPFLEKTGLRFEGYAKENLNRRPVIRPATEEAEKVLSNPEDIRIKVIRPQDMPQHVACGSFDLAVSGTDWLFEHRLRFPTSPVAEEPLLKMGFGKVRIVAAVLEGNGKNIKEFIKNFRKINGSKRLKIASEYVYIADYYAGRNNLHPYRIIMTYGATESLIPEDCDLIVENTETGSTLRQNRLIVADEIMESEACIIANRKTLEESPEKQQTKHALLKLFQKALQKD